MGSSLVVLLALSIALAYAQDPGDVDFSQDVDFQEPYYAVVSDSQSDQTANIEFSGVRVAPSTAVTEIEHIRLSSRGPAVIRGNGTRGNNSAMNNATDTPTTPLFDYSSYPPVVVKTAVILTKHAGTPYDHDVLAPALDIAFARARRDYNVIFDKKDYLYEVDPAPTDPALLVGRTPGCWMWNASGMASYAINNSVNVIVGPACTDDMRAVNELTTFFDVVTVTGAANLIDSTSGYRYLTRCGYNTYDMWTFLIKMFQHYQWTSICVIYDFDSTQFSVEAASLIQNLKDKALVPYDIRINGTEFEDFDSIPNHLKDCGRQSRVIIFVMKGHLTRYFLIQASRQKLLNGEYVFFTADIFLEDIMGPSGNWKQRDGYDKEAMAAYQHLFILTIRDSKGTLEYQHFATDVRHQARRHYNKTSDDDVVINYYSATFHDGIVMLARALRQAREKPLFANQVPPQVPRSQNTIRFMWNSTFRGASGRVYINPDGDRSDDLTIYKMINGTMGHFSVVAEYFGLVGNYSEVEAINWGTPDGSPPLNQPLCGYLEDLCIDTVTAAAIGGSLGAVVVLAFLIGCLVCYCRTKDARARADNDWIAEWEDLQMDVVGAGSSRMSMNSLNSSSKSMSKPSLQSDEEGGSLRKRRKPPPSNGKLGFANWQGRLVMVIICEKQLLRLNRSMAAEIKLVRNLSDEHILKFLGAVLGPDNVAVLGEYCSKGTLQDLLADETAKLDWIFRYSLLSDIVKGISFLHGSALGCHGRLTSACCYVDGKFVLKVGNYGLPTLYRKAIPHELNFQYYASMFWTAPELLDYPNGPGTQEGDVYAYGIILQEVILREEPYSMYTIEPEEIIAKVRTPELFFRPSVPSTDGALGLLSLMEQCWQEDPMERPRFPQIKTSLRQMTRGAVEKSNIVDLLISQMESYTADLERMVEEKTLAFQEEKTKADALLNQILPSSVAEKLKKGEAVPPEQFESATIFFSDIVGFQTMALESTAIQIVDFLNDLYSLFDGTMPKFDVYKVETIQDSYMVASGLPVRNGLNHAKEQALLSLTLMDLIKSFKIRHRPDETARLRVGLNSGPVVTSVIGLAVPRYCLFGDTVNTASRMESTGQGLKIQISPSTKAILDGFGLFTMKERGEIEVKGKGKIRTYWLTGEKDDALIDAEPEPEPPKA
ncbi:Atrial natriuretic peptide receptor 1 [Hypsibius exemplaris]|uniref:guanylate cyclase n=1 Tax=Hypsibius exemplaris TaxID=2072580 RepID=A0A1W0WSP4_HYPEX|nr:Atrial natriuretic peptide receptor 1 [Hypsibius exemplaris]